MHLFVKLQHIIGYELPLLLPNLVNVTFSTYDNSYNPCFGAITNAVMCDDYQECNGLNLDTSDSNAPICCTAFEGCDGAINMTSKIALNSSVIDGVSVRCDGYYGCNDVSGIIYAKNGGNMYFAGRYTVYGTVNSVIAIASGQSGDYNIVCSGLGSCRATSLI